MVGWRGLGACRPAAHPPLRYFSAVLWGPHSACNLQAPPHVNTYVDTRARPSIIAGMENDSTHIRPVITTRLDPDLLRRLDRWRKAEGMPRARALDLAIAELLEKRDA